MKHEDLQVHRLERADIASRSRDVLKLNYADTPRFLVSCVTLAEVAANDHIWSRDAGPATAAGLGRHSTTLLGES
jgi:hypothetical protein